VEDEEKFLFMMWNLRYNKKERGIFVSNWVM